MGEEHGSAFAKFGEECGDRHVVLEDLVVIPKKNCDKAKEILSEMRLGPPPDDETPASLACLAFADRIDKALSGNNVVVKCLGSVRMKTADGKVLTGWLVSQTGMLC